MPVTLNYTPHPGQRQIHAARGSRFRSVCCGRRWGKTLCCAGEVLDRGGGEASGDYGWVAPTYTIADRGVDAFREIAPDFVRFSGRNPVVAHFTGVKGPCRVFFLSADNIDGNVGFGFQGLVVDEAARIPVNAWNYTFRPTIGQTYGWAIFISTPKGRNWFYDQFTRGLDNTPGYQSFTFPSNSSPYFPAIEWEEGRRDFPSDVFRQEYEAEFLEDSAGVFRGIDACAMPTTLIVPTPDNQILSASTSRAPILIGCDIAKHTDFTVLIAMNGETGECLEMLRFNQLDWPIQKERIIEFAKRWGGRIMLDATGIGDPIYDDLIRVYSDIEPVKFTSPVKTALIQRLIVSVEQRQITWPEAWEVLTAEMKRYEYDIGPTGRLTYNAPAGYHDDCVISLALANYGRHQIGNVGHMARFTHGLRGRTGRFGRSTSRALPY